VDNFGTALRRVKENIGIIVAFSFDKDQDTGNSRMDRKKGKTGRSERDI